jgi:CO/xanthine dehydrogenase FAD-binding subunit
MSIVVLPGIETKLTGQPLTIEALREVKELVTRGLSPIDDLRATADYRKKAAGNLLLKLLDC